MRRHPRDLVLALWALLAALSSGFAFTDGLAYFDPGMPITHVRELQGSAGNDDLCVEIGLVFGVAGVLWGALRTRRRFGIADWAVNGVLVAAQGAYLAAIEAGSIQQTIARDRNWVLAAWLAAYTGVAIAVGVAARTGMTERGSVDASAPTGADDR